MRWRRNRGGKPPAKRLVPVQINRTTSVFAFVAKSERQYFFLEMDGGTETIVPGDARLREQSFWRGTSLLRRFVIYASAFETRAHVAAFGFPDFRVLTVTTTPARAEAM